jgi:hypothetical protein
LLVFFSLLDLNSPCPLSLAAYLWNLILPIFNAAALLGAASALGFD